MKLDPVKHDWLQDARARRILTALGPDKARYVGGAIRNSLLGAPVSDIDIAVALTPDEVVAALKAANIRYVPTGLDHGTVTAIIESRPYEITSLREDVSTDGRRATVNFTRDWAIDAHRRDFTVNALYADIEGQIFDPTGQGLDDIASPKFRFVGKAEDRVTEDYLRILRYFRFSAWYGGEAKLDAAALTACRGGLAGLKQLSAERVWSEMKKLLTAPNPTRIVHIMLTQGVLEAIFPEASNAEGLELFIALEQRETVEPDPLLRLMAMSAREPFPMALLTKRLKMSNAEKKRLRGWAEDDTPFNPAMTERERLAAIYKTGQRRAMDRCLIRAAGERDAIISARWMSLVDLAQSWTPPDFPLTGKDLIAAGVLPGESMGKTMNALKALWVKSGFIADKQKLLMALRLLSR